VTPLRTNKNIDGGMGQNVKPNQKVREPKGRRYEATDVKYSTSAPCDRCQMYRIFTDFWKIFLGSINPVRGGRKKTETQKKYEKKHRKWSPAL